VAAILATRCSVGVSAFGERRRVATGRELERLARSLARLDVAPRRALGRAQLGERQRELETGLGRPEELNCVDAGSCQGR
jgi:hypothetical protein